MRSRIALYPHMPGTWHSITLGWGMNRIYNWTAIQTFHDEGNGFSACRLRFGLTHTAWIKAIRRGELRTVERPFEDRRRRYNWAEIQAYYDAGHTLVECMARFNFCRAAWHKARQRGEIRPRPRAGPLETLLATSTSRIAVKRRLLRDGLLTPACSICGLTSWRGQPLICHIDHINGVGYDHRLENLRMLCPNCHSQTPTYAGRNARRKRLQGPGRVV